MPTYLLDTSTFSWLMRDDPAVRSRIDALSKDDRLVICTTVRGEILYGIERLPVGERRRALEMKARQLFSAIPCESVTPGAADRYAQLKRAAEVAGTALAENDLWIAASAQALEAVLVASDDDYSRLPALKVESWRPAKQN